MDLTTYKPMDNQEVIARLADHFRVHNDGRLTPYLDEAVDTMFDSLEKYSMIVERFGSFEKLMSIHKDRIRDEIEPNMYDIYDSGFAAGIHWALYFFRNTINQHMTDDELIKLASWFELKLPYKDLNEWYRLMKDAIK